MKKQADDNDKKLIELEQQVEELKNKYLRALADYQNLEKRIREQHEETRKFASLSLVRQLLPVLDGLSRAQDHIQDQGLALVIGEFGRVLSDIGVERIPLEGVQFDPELMECTEVAEGLDNTVLAIHEDGYTMHGKVIRPARVTVGKQRENDSPEAPNIK